MRIAHIVIDSNSPEVAYFPVCRFLLDQSCYTCGLRLSINTKVESILCHYFGEKAQHCILFTGFSFRKSDYWANCCSVLNCWGKQVSWLWISQMLLLLSLICFHFTTGNIHLDSYRIFFMTSTGLTYLLQILSSQNLPGYNNSPSIIQMNKCTQGYCYGLNGFPPKFICWNPNLYYFRCWPYLKTRSFQR